MSAEYEKKLIAPELLFAAISEELALGRYASFTVTGQSMWPFICHGRDQVVVVSCDPGKLRIGDIILFQTPLGNYILHRITGLKEESFETTGDGNCFRDGWFPLSCVRAKVITIIRGGRKINCYSPAWRFAFMLWRKLFPVRGQLLKLCAKIGHAKARIRKWQQKQNEH